MKNIILRTAISLLFIGLLFYFMRDQIPQVVAALRQVDRPLLIGAVLLFLTTVWILGCRLKVIFKAKGVAMGLQDAVNLTFVGYFFNNFLPTSVGGDIVKAMCASRITQNPVKSVTSVLMDRIFGLFVFILIPSLTLLFYMKNIADPRVPIIVYSLLAFSAFCFFLIFNRGIARRFGFIETLLSKVGIGAKVRELYDGLHDFRYHKDAVVISMLLSVVGQTISILVLYAMAVALGSHTAVVYFFLLVPVVHLVSMLPSLGGLGIREGAYVYFLKDYVGEHNAFALGILWLGLLFLLSIIGGLIYLVRHDYHIRLKQAVTPAAGNAA
jgi:glycosyltransferase 2 family protein